MRCLLLNEWRAAQSWSCRFCQSSKRSTCQRSQASVLSLGYGVELFDVATAVWVVLEGQFPVALLDFLFRGFGRQAQQLEGRAHTEEDVDFGEGDAFAE
jgi:hypothetical protein